MREFFPIGEESQGDYESLRSAVLAGTPLLGALSARFERGGLVALITSPQPVSAPCFVAELVGASRPAWTPYADPRDEAMAECYGLLLDSFAVPMSLTSKEA
ncbi:MAG TPA: hypothetical protein VE991_11975 [Acidimicrobiales bacterium]|nr:hypothetical protein [Acidimicrobiales bacterium]